MPASYGLFGYPVQHSWSPFIHGMFAKQTGQDMEYRLFESPPERFRAEVLEFFRAGGSGVNVTVPHKRAATDLVNELTPRAQVANAINTIVRRDESLVGDNTDGTGLLARPDAQPAPRACPCRGSLILGAGAAALRHHRAAAARLEPRRAASSRTATAERARRARGGLRRPRRGQRLRLRRQLETAALRPGESTRPSATRCGGDVPGDAGRRGRPAGPPATTWRTAAATPPFVTLGEVPAALRRARTGLGHAGRAGRRGVLPLARCTAGHGACPCSAAHAGD